MKIGYGRNRSEKEFQDAGCDRCFIDHGDSFGERNKMLQGGAVRGIGDNSVDRGGNEPDLVFLFQHGELGADWRDRRRVLDFLAAKGVAVQVRDQEPVLYDTEEKRAAFKAQNGGTKTTRDPGRPAKWSPKNADLIEFALTWYDPLSSMTAVRTEANRLFGEMPPLNAIKYRLGPRNGSDKRRLEAQIGSTWEAAVADLEDKE